jgi:hypothetical protein
MKRSVIVALFSGSLLGLCAFGFPNPARPDISVPPIPAGKIAVPCPETLNDITDCPDTGCGPSLDPNLNRQKNIRSDDREAEPMTIQQIRNLPDPVPGFHIGDTRSKLAALGEGKKIVVVANALVARKGGAESCNCKLTSVADTDNHIVLVDRVLRIRRGETAKQTLSRREENSITAEFAPRPRLDSSNLTRANLQPLIAVDGVQKIRVTGLLMFDSEHSLGHHLKRHNNWEIHPILDMDYCPRRKRCTADSDANWVKLGEEP